LTGEDVSSEHASGDGELHPLLFKGKQPAVDEDVPKVPSIPPAFGIAAMEDKWVRRGLEMIPAPLKANFLERWNRMEIQELELFRERSGLIHELANWMFESRKNADK
jgi:hypothetical protein